MKNNQGVGDFDSTVQQTSDRHRWARRMLDAAEGPIPSYGSPEWLALPEGDRRKVAAVVIAAECWATDPEWTWIEALYAATAFRDAEDADYLARADAHRREWSNLRPCKGAYADRGEVS